VTLELGKDAIDLGIVVTDAEAMVAFYRDVLGLDYLGAQPVGPGGVMHELACGQSVIKLVQPDVPPRARHATGAVRAATGLRYFILVVRDIEAVVRRCEAAGAEFPVPLKENPNAAGGRHAQVADPEGNIVALQQPPEA
jgi:predicted enzyme related to lactoylglutathione lyase